MLTETNCRDVCGKKNETLQQLKYADAVLDRKKNIRVRNRATMTKLILGLDGDLCHWAMHWISYIGRQSLSNPVCRQFKLASLIMV